MAKRLMIVSVLLFSVTLFSGLAWATVTGSWDVTGKMKVKVSAKKVASASQTVGFWDYFNFGPGTSFHMTDMDGTWSQNKTKFSVYLDSLDLASTMGTLLQDLIWYYGYDVDVIDVSVTKNSFTGKEGKIGNTIGGKIKLAVSVLVYSYDLDMYITAKATVAATFSGTRSFAFSPLGNSKAVESDKSPDGMDAFLRPLVDSIMTSVLNPNADLPL
ncbi:MAG: hypothetical protein U1E51_14660 [Candidatus Binatia bacterium]|nr:hypothetical protein [Candidatus Binatia bacterium]